MSDRERRLAAVFTLILGVCAALSVWTCVQLARARSDFRAQIEDLRRTIFQQEHVMRTEWIDVNGFTREVITTREPGEEINQWLDRHQAEVAEALLRWPKAT